MGFIRKIFTPSSDHPFWYLYVVCVSLAGPTTLALVKVGDEWGFGWISSVSLIIGYGGFLYLLMKDFEKTKHSVRIV